MAPHQEKFIDLQNNLAKNSAGVSIEIEENVAKNSSIEASTSRKNRFFKRLREIGVFSLNILVIIGAIPLLLFRELSDLFWFRILGRVNPKKLQNLKGKVILITGATSGIGECLAKYFYLAGAQLILAARRKNELERVKNELISQNSNLLPPFVLQLDLSNKASLPPAVENIMEIFGRIDILINNAGIFNQGSCLATSLQVDEEIMSVNYFGPLYLTKLVSQEVLLKKALPVHIVFVSSLLGKITIANSEAYSASKHALQALSDGLLVEKDSYGEDKMKVTMISPGYVNTPISGNTLSSHGGKLDEEIKEVKEGYDTDYVCKKMFKSIVNEQEELVVAPLLYKFGVFLRNFWPRMYFFVIKFFTKPTLVE